MNIRKISINLFLGLIFSAWLVGDSITDAHVGIVSETGTELHLQYNFDNLNLHEIIINGNLLGGIDIATVNDSTKKLLQQFFDGISLNNEQYITKRSANISNQPQVVVQTNEPDIVTKIKQLNEFKEKGLISEEDFNSKKTELLDKM